MFELHCRVAICHDRDGPTPNQYFDAVATGRDPTFCNREARVAAGLLEKKEKRLTHRWRNSSLFLFLYLKIGQSARRPVGFGLVPERLPESKLIC